MEIKVIKCSRLNESPHGGSKDAASEVAVRFYDSGGNPKEIMCDKYDSEKGCSLGRDNDTNMVKYVDCIFSEWKPLKKRGE